MDKDDPFREALDKLEAKQKQRRAERRLAEAAPDLLAALKGIVAITVNPHDGGQYEDGEVPALDAARAVIARAEGREP